MRYAYIVICVDQSLYTWVTTDIERRINEHNSWCKWAKYTRMRRPVKLVRSREFESKSEACAEEYRIKKLSREQKLLLV